MTQSERGGPTSSPKDEPDLDLYRYVPFYIRSIANRLFQIDKRLYSQRLDVGLNEWSCLALLMREEDISASRICEVSGYDKAVVSRSVQALQKKGLVAARSVPSHNRKLLLSLTDKGCEVYRQVEALVLERERLLLDGMSADEKETLIRLLAKMLERSDALLGDEADRLPSL